MCGADQVMNARFAYQESVHQDYKQFNVFWGLCSAYALPALSYDSKNISLE